MQDELSACLMVTGEEVLETLGPLVFCVFIWVRHIEMGCHSAERTICLPHDNGEVGAGNKGLVSPVFCICVEQIGMGCHFTG